MFNFPWTNFHELNLDWILSVVKEAKEVFDNGRSDIDYAVDTADEAKEIATQAAEATIADNSISTQKLQNAAVTNAKLANNSVTTDKIVDRTIIGNDIAENTIESYNIKNGTIIGADIAENTIETDNIKGGAVTNAKIADSSVNTSKIADGAVTLDKLSGTLNTLLVKNPAIIKAYIQYTSVTIASNGYTAIDTIAQIAQKVSLPALNNYQVIGAMIRYFEDGEIYSIIRGSDGTRFYAVGKPGVTKNFGVEYVFYAASVENYSE